LLTPGGQLVAIIPRSFCNGPYYRSFRNFLFQNSAIRQIHLFDSRTKGFKDDDVLQENIIISLERNGKQNSIIVSTSTDQHFIDYESHKFPFDQIVFPNDEENFIHIPTKKNDTKYQLSPKITYTLNDLEIKVSTGPVVDFRLRDYLFSTPGVNTVPLLYPGHFIACGIEWPNNKFKKPNAILRNSETEKWLYPNDFYCVVRRFSSKEEKRRIVASVVDPNKFKDVTALGFENHLNVFHDNKHGLSKQLAFGLSVFLNSTAVDEFFRRFNGHTQVNATDLRTIKYPSREILIKLGEWAIECKNINQTMIDDKLMEVTK
jgi:adenine-specific DNA-methyltransferase